LVRVLGGEEQRVESSRLKSRVVWLYYLGSSRLWNRRQDHGVITVTSLVHNSTGGTVTRHRSKKSPTPQGNPADQPSNGWDRSGGEPSVESVKRVASSSDSLDQPCFCKIPLVLATIPFLRGTELEYEQRNGIQLSL